jgi:hypothetical protein
MVKKTKSRILCVNFKVIGNIMSLYSGGLFQI